jgi:hypothetical protein
LKINTLVKYRWLKPYCRFTSMCQVIQKKLTKRCVLFLTVSLSSFRSICQFTPRNNQTMRFISFSLFSLRYRVRSLTYSLGFIYSFAICSSLKLFTCIDVSLREELCMLRVKSTDGGMYSDLYRSRNCSSGGGVF